MVGLDTGSIGANMFAFNRKFLNDEARADNGVVESTINFPCRISVKASENKITADPIRLYQQRELACVQRAITYANTPQLAIFTDPRCRARDTRRSNTPDRRFHREGRPHPLNDTDSDRTLLLSMCFPLNSSTRRPLKSIAEIRRITLLRYINDDLLNAR